MPFVRKQAVASRTVKDALNELCWVRDIFGGLTVAAIVDYLHLWDALHEFELQDDRPDKHIWTRTASGVYSTKSAYDAFLLGGIKFEPHKRLWKAWAPLKCKIFLWLAILNRCWTADRLERHGLQHADRCLLCDQKEETVQHILTDCVFARDVWFRALGKVGLQRVAPGQEDTVLCEWWRRAARRVGREQRKGFNTYVILITWQIWKMCNRCAFDGAQPLPLVDIVMAEIRDEATMWTMAGPNSSGRCYSQLRRVCVRVVSSRKGRECDKRLTSARVMTL
ncbi:hypothetical protein EJB05_52059, partial [Eragrostis curvula]